MPDKNTFHSSLMVEPQGLLEHFFRYPPVGFEPFLTTEDGTPGFFAPFDLLTTADDGLVEGIQRIPGHKWLRKMLTLRTCFIGSTASEYCPLNSNRDSTTLLNALMDTWRRRSLLLIIKDIPVQSPLLSSIANQQANAFTKACEEKGFFFVDGQALAYVPIDFSDQDEYLGRLSSGRRRDIRRKLRSRADLRIEILKTGSDRFQDESFLEELYEQYLEVFAQSEIHFDLLSRDFFNAIFQDSRLEGRVFLYFRNDALLGFNLCFIHEGMLIDKYVGFRYPAAREFNLYFVSWMENLAFAREHGLRWYVAGWTDPEIKAYLGAKFTFTRHAVFVRNPVLRRVLSKFSGHFESDRKWFDANIQYDNSTLS